MALFTGCGGIFPPGSLSSKRSVDKAALKEKIDQALDSAGENAVWSVQIVERASGDVIYARNPRKNLIPASNVKLFTTAAAFKFLGADYRFTTPLLTDGQIDSSGRLMGNIYIIGSGDPAITGRFHNDYSAFVFEEWAEKLRELGINSIQGGLIGVDTVFTAGRAKEPTWEWGDLKYHFAVPASGLCFNDNCIWVELFTPIFKDTVMLKAVPAYNGIEVRSNLSVCPPTEKTKVTFNWDFPDSILTIEGRITAGERKSIMIPVNDPARHFMRSLTSVFSVSGIEVMGSVKAVTAIAVDESSPQVSLDTLFIHRSPPLLEICRALNVESVNLYAEQLLRTIGREVYSEGSPEAGLSALENMLAEAGVEAGEVHLVDGSGLSRHNWTSAESIVKLLSACADWEFGGDFFSTMPEYGEGTLKNRIHPAPGFAVRVKTGSMSGVRALSGLAKCGSREYIFSLICNNYTAPSAQIEEAMDTVIAGICGW